MAAGSSTVVGIGEACPLHPEGLDGDRQSAAYGGGIFNWAATIQGSTVSLNVAEPGGGILSHGALAFGSTQTTVGANTGTSDVGGIWNSGGTMTGGCAVSLGGNALYSPSNMPTNYAGFNCPMPIPQLATNGTEDYVDALGGPYTKYKLTITNWADFEREHFVQAPDLPPCGLNGSASRTWVDIHRAVDSSDISGFCVLSAPSDLTQIWFGLPRGTAPPPSVYVTLTDRLTDQVITSNSVGFTP